MRIACTNLWKKKVENSSRSPLKTLQDMLEESVAWFLILLLAIFILPRLYYIPSIQMKNRCSDFFARKRSLIVKLLVKAAAAGEIPKSKANEDVALALMMGTSALFPPYYNNYFEADARVSKADLCKRASILIKTLISGLKK